MAETDKKIVLEREYIVPLRMGWLKVQKYKRANKAVKTLKEFMVRHMKVYDRDLRKIKVDIYVNNEIRFRGMKKPLDKIKVKAIKYDNGDVVVRLAELPKHIEFELARKARKDAEKVKKSGESDKTKEKIEPQADNVNDAEKQKDIKEKEESSKLAEEQIEKNKANEVKHQSKMNRDVPEIKRKALKR